MDVVLRPDMKMSSTDVVIRVLTCASFEFGRGVTRMVDVPIASLVRIETGRTTVTHCDRVWLVRS